MTAGLVLRFSNLVFLSAFGNRRFRSGSFARFFRGVVVRIAFLELCG